MNISIEDLTPLPTGKVGFTALLGRPNTGKSTFLNTVLDFHLAAVSSKPQTTQKNCLGIFSDDQSQIMFLDAPGVHECNDALDEAMETAVQNVLTNADLILCLVDPTRPPGREDRMVANAAAKAKKECIVAINKIDIAKPEQITEMILYYKETLPNAKYFQITATKRKSVTPVLEQIKQILPEGHFHYSPDTITDAYERHIATDLIRETVLNTLREEVPHATAVTIELWDEHPNHLKIHATLNVEREQQKRIVIGNKGTVIKKIREFSQKKLRKLCNKRVKLELWVKVVPKWRRNKSKLIEFNLLEKRQK